MSRKKYKKNNFFEGFGSRLKNARKELGFKILAAKNAKGREGRRKLAVGSRQLAREKRSKDENYKD
ncbi:MAG: hypothetical protein GTO45_06455 [Candidatus Aminicenantes bacterium]|nr:hypothetical protein [Candidatus Aminicenantes bacterium]NIM78465.1 hypothetical protein [Candidatus Aminicenantes bacterium]NIN17728.1 hypothetical protein [Candidatus Aminicenantes bacterium]NIN41604.1 hypothetical protein [Candidatus Aminicenantes bacterium]NIN84378.1 hypothetical protein [Candidatus Aminicenantes bacterium]